MCAEERSGPARQAVQTLLDCTRYCPAAVQLVIVVAAAAVVVVGGIL